jgi:hypothetical protein
MRAVFLGAFLALLPAGVRADSLLPWLGKWTSGDNEISLARSGNMISARGKAYYPSKNDPNANLGFFKGRGRPADGRMVVRDGDCTVTMTLDHGGLQVDDNNLCGGFNVTFRETYGSAER